MEHLPKIGMYDHPESFAYEPVLEQGPPEHQGDYFSAKHPHMDYGRRAKIFAPFAALKGFEEEVQSKGVRYEKKRDLDPDELYDLNRQLHRLQMMTCDGRFARENMVKAEVEYYMLCEDEHNKAFHSKGQYVTMKEVVYQVDETAQQLRIGDRMIPFKDIYAIRFPTEEERK